MTHEGAKGITDCVEQSISRMTRLFEREPSRFFTETDILAHLRMFLHESLKELDLDTVLDSNGQPNSLIHSEFPTPFRCDMRGRRFEVKTDEDRTPNNSLYKRGHFDIVVLSPGFVARHPFEVLKSQDFKIVQQAIIPQLVRDDPAIVHGIELLYRRDPIKHSQGQDKWKAANTFVEEILQDEWKLGAARSIGGFMQNATTLVFIKGTAPDVVEMIRFTLAGITNIEVIAAQ